MYWLNEKRISSISKIKVFSKHQIRSNNHSIIDHGKSGKRGGQKSDEEKAIYIFAKKNIS